MYLFIYRPEKGMALIEAIFPEVRTTPLYILINNPLKALMGEGFVKKRVNVANFAEQVLIKA